MKFYLAFISVTQAVLLQHPNVPKAMRPDKLYVYMLTSMDGLMLTKMAQLDRIITSTTDKYRTIFLTSTMTIDSCIP